MSATSILILAALSAFAGFVAGYIVGDRNGRACEWCDRLFSDIEKERARRDRLGRFRAKKEAL